LTPAFLLARVFTRCATVWLRLSEGVTNQGSIGVEIVAVLLTHE
jgi:hypothetical protein